MRYERNRIDLRGSGFSYDTCLDCGVLVGVIKTHDEWHERNDFNATNETTEKENTK